MSISAVPALRKTPLTARFRHRSCVRAHQHSPSRIVCKPFTSRLRHQLQCQTHQCPTALSAGRGFQVPGSRHRPSEHGELHIERARALAVPSVCAHEREAALPRHRPLRRDERAGSQGTRARSEGEIVHAAFQDGCRRRAHLHIRVPSYPRGRGYDALFRKLDGNDNDRRVQPLLQLGAEHNQHRMPRPFAQKIRRDRQDGRQGCQGRIGCVGGSCRTQL